jgi:hypothetical protein
VAPSSEDLPATEPRGERFVEGSHGRDRSPGAGGVRPATPAASAHSATAASTSAAAPTTAAVTQTIDLSANWVAMVDALNSGYAGGCTLAFACTGTNPLTNASIQLSNLGVKPMTQIKVEYDEDANDTTTTGASLDLGHFALFFSTAAGSQFDFQTFVTDSMNETAVGEVKTKLYAPLEIVLQRPDTGQWVLTVKQSS